MPFPPFPDAPTPIEATFGQPVTTVMFDRPLEVGALDPANWTVRHGGSVYSVTSAAANGSMVELNLGFNASDPGLPGVSYAATPPDVKSAEGVPAEPFSDFPFA